MLALLRHNPRAMVLSVLLHLGLLFLLLWAREQQISYMDSVAPIQSPQPDESIPVIVQDNRVAERLEELSSDRQLLRRVVFWATLNWLLDAAG